MRLFLTCCVFSCQSLGHDLVALFCSQVQDLLQQMVSIIIIQSLCSAIKVSFFSLIREFHLQQCRFQAMSDTIVTKNILLLLKNPTFPNYMLCCFLKLKDACFVISSGECCLLILPKILCVLLTWLYFNLIIFQWKLVR